MSCVSLRKKKKKKKRGGESPKKNKEKRRKKKKKKKKKKKFIIAIVVIPHMAFDEKKKNKSSVGSLIDLSVPSGAETSLETLEYAWRKLGRESNGERARLAREVTRNFCRDDGRDGENSFGFEKFRDERLKSTEAFCEEFLELLREEKEGREDGSSRTGEKDAEKLREALMNVRKDARAVHELEETLELKQLHLEMLRERRRCSRSVWTRWKG